MKRTLVCLLAVAIISGLVIADSGLPFRAKRQQPKKNAPAQQRRLPEKKRIQADPTDPNGWKMLSLYTVDGHQKPGEYYRMRTDLEAKEKKYGDISQRAIFKDGKWEVEDFPDERPDKSQPPDDK